MPAPIKWTPDFELLNNENPEGEPWLSASPDGRFSLLFFESFTGPPVHTDLEERIYSAAGSELTAIGTTFSTPTSEHQVASAYFADGRRVYVWTEESALGGGDLEDVFAEIRFGNNGVDVARFLVSGGAGRQHDPIVATSSNGFVVAMVDDSTPVDRLILKFYNLAGTLTNTVLDATGAGSVATGDADLFRDVEVTALANGNYVVVWDSPFNTDVFARIYTQGGTAVSGVIDVQTGLPTAGFGDVTALADGGFVVTYAQFPAGELFGRLFDADGIAAGPAFLVATGLANAINNQVQTAALQDGRFVSVWVTDSFDIAGQVMFADGTADGGPFVVNTDTAGTQSRPTIATLADGRFAVSWESGAGASATIITTIFDPREAGINLIGTTVGDDYIGTGFDDVISTGAGNDTLQGAAGNDLLNGGTGADLMIGGDGGDVYHVSILTDQVIETNADLLTGGDDLVTYTGISGAYVLTQGVERLGLGGVSATGGTGNALNNTLTGNAAANVLTGLAGDDVLDGKAGADTLLGGTGNDQFIVGTFGDVVVELAGEGTADRLLASVSYVLGAGVQVERMQTTSFAGTGAINLTGNALGQTIIGNAGANTLEDGAGAADTLTGAAGNDTYVVRTAGTLIVEGVGEGSNDRVLAAVSFVLAGDDHIELMQTTSFAGVGSINLTGNALAQTIIGNAGANVINGAAGNDTLTGGAGADDFIFNTALGATNIDGITDFVAGLDDMLLRDTMFAGIGVGALAANEFHAGASGQALNADTRIIYETNNGNLWYDADGTGAILRVQFGDLAAGLAVTASDFAVF